MPKTKETKVTTKKKATPKKPTTKKVVTKKKSELKKSVAKKVVPENTTIQPIFQLVSQYARDVSAECIIAGHTLKNDPIVQLDIGVGGKDLGDNHHEANLRLKCEAKDETGAVVYLVEVEYTGIFTVKGVSDEHIRPLMAVDAASLLFPFARQIIMNSVTTIGHRPRIIEPINFHALYQQSVAQAQGVA